jgi:hypothetical protein
MFKHIASRFAAVLASHRLRGVQGLSGWRTAALRHA